jgi:hypothetical protein
MRKRRQEASECEDMLWWRARQCQLMNSRRSWSDKGASVTRRVISPEMLTYHALLETKSLHEHMSCDRVARIEMALLNQLMETTGLDKNIGWSGDGIKNMVTFSIRYFPHARSTDRARRFPGVLSCKFSKGS